MFLLFSKTIFSLRNLCMNVSLQNSLVRHCSSGHPKFVGRSQRARPGAERPWAAIWGPGAGREPARSARRARRRRQEEGPGARALPKDAPSYTCCHLAEPGAGEKAAPLPWKLDCTLPPPGLSCRPPRRQQAPLPRRRCPGSFGDPPRA